MALSHYLQLSTSMNPAQALEHLTSQIPGLTWSEDRYLLLDPTIKIHAVESRALTQDIIKEAFQFKPTLTIGFRFTNNTDDDRAGQLMFQATMLMLEKAQDAVLLFNGEVIVLQWLGGQLAFNSDHHVWDEDWLKRRLTIPFECRPLPSPLL
jgi:hypothetical protein